MAKTYINITQHHASPEQVSAGVMDAPEGVRLELCKLLTFEEVPDLHELRERAMAIATLAAGGVDAVRAVGDTPVFMLGGAPFFMPVLARALSGVHSCECVYAFAKRVAVEDAVTGVKTSVFKHEGFVHHYD